MVGEQAGGGSNPPSQLPISQKENMENKADKVIANVPMSMLPEETSVGSRFEVSAVIDGMDGDMATVRLESFEMEEQPEEQVTEEDARNAAMQMDEQMGYME